MAAIGSDSGLGVQGLLLLQKLLTHGGLCHKQSGLESQLLSELAGESGEASVLSKPLGPKKEELQLIVSRTKLLHSFEVTVLGCLHAGHRAMLCEPAVNPRLMERERGLLGSQALGRGAKPRGRNRERERVK